MKLSICTLLVVLTTSVPLASAQSSASLPAGFQADPASAAMNIAGVSYGTSGTKTNDNMSPCFTDPKVSFSYGWSLNPAAKMMVDMLLKAPQEPASNSSQTGVLDEPVSKQAYQNGVLEWRKQTWPVITGHPCKDSQVVFYSAKWVGYSGNKLLGISIYNLYKSKEQGQAWIDEYIPKVTASVNGK